MKTILNGKWIDTEEFPETFIHHEDRTGICIKCGGKKEWVNVKKYAKQGIGKHYWRYSGVAKDCKHYWRKAD